MNNDSSLRLLTPHEDPQPPTSSAPEETADCCTVLGDGTRECSDHGEQPAPVAEEARDVEYMRAFFDGTWDSFIAQVPRSIEGTDALLTFAKKHPKVCKGAGSEPIALLAVYVDHKRL